MKLVVLLLPLFVLGCLTDPWMLGRGCTVEHTDDTGTIKIRANNGLPGAEEVTKVATNIAGSIFGGSQVESTTDYTNVCESALDQIYADEVPSEE